MKAIKLTVSGKIEVMDKPDWGWQDIAKQINASLIEPVSMTEGYFAYCDEEGKLLGKKENVAATALWYDSGARILLGDYIAGDVIFFGEIDQDGEQTSVPEYLLDVINKYVKNSGLGNAS